MKHFERLKELQMTQQMKLFLELRMRHSMKLRSLCLKPHLKPHLKHLMKRMSLHLKLHLKEFSALPDS